jgi:hypothetical protein
MTSAVGAAVAIPLREPAETSPVKDERFDRGATALLRKWESRTGHE